MSSYIISKDKELLINRHFTFIKDIECHNGSVLYLFLNNSNDNVFTEEEKKLIIFTDSTFFNSNEPNAYIRRMEIEKEEVSNRAEKLQNYLERNTVQGQEKTLMEKQLKIMLEYIQVLGERISVAIEKEKNHEIH